MKQHEKEHFDDGESRSVGVKQYHVPLSMSDCMFIAIKSIACHYFKPPVLGYSLLPSSPEINGFLLINEKCSASWSPNAEPCISVVTGMFHQLGVVINTERKCSSRGERGIDSINPPQNPGYLLMLVQFSSLHLHISVCNSVHILVLLSEIDKC